MSSYAIAARDDDPPESLELLFPAVYLLTFQKTDKDEQKQKLKALCKRFGKINVRFRGSIEMEYAPVLCLIHDKL